jgi:ABC-type branched-subunit amino acid transport system permease subunit
MDRAKLRAKYLSLKGHVVFYGGATWLVGSLSDIEMHYEFGNELTFGMLVRSVLSMFVAGVLGGVLVWYLITLPYLRSSRNSK